MIFIILFVFSTNANENTKIDKNYNNTLIAYQNWSDNLCNSDFYAKKTIVFKNLTGFEKDMFYLAQFFDIMEETDKLAQIWYSNNTSNDYNMKLYELRTKLAKKVYEQTCVILDKHKNIISDKEIAFHKLLVFKHNVEQGLF